jgi:RNA polymerase sigma factor (sigma-70 family)
VKAGEVAMTDGASPEVDLELLIYRMAERDEAALAEFVESCGGKIKGYLEKHFGEYLREPEISAAVNMTFFNVWEGAERFRIEKGMPKAWMIRIARNAAIDILRGERRHRAKDLKSDLAYDPGDHCDDDADASSSIDPWYVAQLEDIINNELTGLEQAVAQTDLAVGGPADAERLAAQHGTSKETIYITRSKVRRKIRKMILEREALRTRTKGKS